MPVTDAERLRAAGHNVTLATGEYPLVFDFAAMLILEKELGGLAEIGDTIAAWATMGEGHRFNLTELRAFMVAGLAHVPLTPDEVVRGFVLSRTNEYMVAVLAATDEAFLPPEKDGQGNGQSEGQRSSNGTPSTTSPQSDTAAVLTTSGG